MIVPTVGELKDLVATVRAAQKKNGELGWYDDGEGVPEMERLFGHVEALPPNMFFSHASLEGELVVSRALVEKAHQVLNAGPGSAGIGRALVLLREALGE